MKMVDITAMYDNRNKRWHTISSSLPYNDSRCFPGHECRPQHLVVAALIAFHHGTEGCLLYYPPVGFPGQNVRDWSGSLAQTLADVVRNIMQVPCNFGIFKSTTRYVHLLFLLWLALCVFLTIIPESNSFLLYPLTPMKDFNMENPLKICLPCSWQKTTLSIRTLNIFTSIS